MMGAGAFAGSAVVPGRAGAGNAAGSVLGTRAVSSGAGPVLGAAIPGPVSSELGMGASGLLGAAAGSGMLFASFVVFGAGTGAATEDSSVDVTRLFAAGDQT